MAGVGGEGDVVGGGYGRGGVADVEKDEAVLWREGGLVGVFMGGRGKGGIEGTEERTRRKVASAAWM